MTEARGLVPRGLVRGTLVGVGIFNALSAVGGGIGLLTPGSMGIPLETISGAGFTSFVVPALILLVVVGGTQALAAVTELRRMPRARFWGAVAGFAMVVFIFVELAVMRGFSVLHGIYFTTGLLQLALVLALLDVLPGAVQRNPT